MLKQISESFEPILSKFQCAQHCLLSILEKWKTAADSKKNFGALFTDLSKAFDCLSHEVLLPKLNA